MGLSYDPPTRIAKGKRKGTTGFEPVTRGSAIHCSATELCTHLLLMTVERPYDRLQILLCGRDGQR